jgi:hypothetical protein
MGVCVINHKRGRLVFHALEKHSRSRIDWWSWWLIVVISRSGWSVFSCGRRSSSVAFNGVQVRLHLLVVEDRKCHVFAHNTQRAVLEKRE